MPWGSGARASEVALPSGALAGDAVAVLVVDLQRVPPAALRGAADLLQRAEGEGFGRAMARWGRRAARVRESGFDRIARVLHLRRDGREAVAWMRIGPDAEPEQARQRLAALEDVSFEALSHGKGRWLADRAPADGARARAALRRALAEEHEAPVRLAVAPHDALRHRLKNLARRAMGPGLALVHALRHADRAACAVRFGEALSVRMTLRIADADMRARARDLLRRQLQYIHALVNARRDRGAATRPDASAAEVAPFPLRRDGETLRLRINARQLRALAATVQRFTRPEWRDASSRE